jgi:putative photosynthetic complex assembly protein
MSQIRFEDEHLEKDLIPPVAIKAVGVLLVLVVALAAIARLTGVGTVHTPTDSVAGERAVQAERWISFQFERVDGPLVLVDGVSGETLARFDSAEGGFIRGAIRPLNRERVRGGGAPDAPYRLVRWTDGAVLLEDPVSGTVVDLRAFGPTNAGAFEGFLKTP